MAFQNCKLEKSANELSDSFLNIEFYISTIVGTVYRAMSCHIRAVIFVAHSETDALMLIWQVMSTLITQLRRRF